MLADMLPCEHIPAPGWGLETAVIGSGGVAIVIDRQGGLRLLDSAAAAGRFPACGPSTERLASIKWNCAAPRLCRGMGWRAKLPARNVHYQPPTHGAGARR